VVEAHSVQMGNNHVVPGGGEDGDRAVRHGAVEAPLLRVSVDNEDAHQNAPLG
jgi:hypothetical protein